MGGNHPKVSLWIDNGSTAVAPKHIHHRSLGRGPELYGLCDHLVYVLCQQIQTRRGGANGLRAARPHLRHLRSQHYCRTAERQFTMYRFSVWSVHDAPFGKTESLLVKGSSSLYVSHCQHCRYWTVQLLIERIDFLGHDTPLVS